MMMYLQEAEALDKAIIDRILAIVKEFKKVQALPLLYDKPAVIYHGTTQAIHKNGRFVTCSFMSTTMNSSQAMKYAGDGAGTVYIIEVPPKFPFLNLNDELAQILLPVGTSIIIDKAIFIKGIRFVTCHIESTKINMDPFITLFENPCTVTKQINLGPIAKHELLIKLPAMDCTRSVLKGSSKLYTCSGSRETCIVKDIVKASNPIKLLSNDQHVFVRVINELLASLVYREVYGMNTFSLKMLHNKGIIEGASSFMLASPQVSDIVYNGFNAKDKENILKGFIVDCIMGNWDVFNNNNVGIHDGVAIRTDVGGCMAFRGKGDYNMSYDVNVTPRDHIAITQQPSFKLFVTKLPRMQAIMRDSCNYLLGIKDVQGKLQNVKMIFVSLLMHIQDASQRDRYTKFVSKMISTVMYRDEWYRNHCHVAIDNTLDVPSIINNVANVAQVPVHSPVAFVMTPDKLQALLETRARCHIRGH